MDKGKLKVLRYLVKEQGLNKPQALAVWDILNLIINGTYEIKKCENH